MKGQFAEDPTLSLAIHLFAHAVHMILVRDEEYGKQGGYWTDDERSDAMHALDEGFDEVLNAVNSLLDGKRQVPIVFKRRLVPFLPFTVRIREP
jgi:hypothetical protein